MLDKHWPALRSVGLATANEAKIWSATSRNWDGPFFIEWFEWVDAAAVDTAHQLPEVMAVWEPLGTLCAEMEFADITDLKDA